MDRDKIPLARLYRRLFSRFWPERLKAYDMIAEDLEQRGCRLFKIKQLMPHEIDAKLLTGQIVSIYMKQRLPLKLSQFSYELEMLYAFLLQTLGAEASDDHRAVKELLLAIYDDDDEAARLQVERFFDEKPRRELSVLENMFRCYSYGMWEIRKRYQALACCTTEACERDVLRAAVGGHGVA